MTIRKGEAWGVPSPSTGEVTMAANDRELAALAHDYGTRGDRLTASVAAGDLLATIGLDEPRPIGQRWRFPVDLGLLEITDKAGVGRSVPFVAHVAAHRMLWRGEMVVVMNAPLMTTRLLGPLRLGPRAHPNDGLLDITVGALQWGQRVEAARRAGTGSHLPHPDLRMVRVAEWDHTFDLPVPLWVDGHRIGSYRMVTVSVVADAFDLVA